MRVLLDVSYMHFYWVLKLFVFFDGWFKRLRMEENIGVLLKLVKNP